MYAIAGGHAVDYRLEATAALVIHAQMVGYKISNAFASHEMHAFFALAIN